MTPKEEAIKLVDEYSIILTKNKYDPYWNPSKAKQCALCAVNKIIKEFIPFSTDYIMGAGYWQEIKKEIEKL